MSRRSLDLVRRIVGTAILGIIIASIFGVAPIPLLTKPLIANAHVITADNISYINTSRDGPPFNGNIYYNNTMQINITFKDFISTSAFPNVTIGLRVVDPSGISILFTCNIDATPAVPGAFVKLYSVFVNISNDSSTVSVTYYNATSAPTQDCTPSTLPAIPDKAVIEIFKDSVVFKRLTFIHTNASDVKGIPTSIFQDIDISTINLTATFGSVSNTFNFTAPDLNRNVNISDSSVIFVAFGNDTKGYNLTNKIVVQEASPNSAVFGNSSIKTLGDLLNVSALVGTVFFNSTTHALKPGSYNISLLIPKTNSTPLPLDLTPNISDSSGFVFNSSVRANFDIINITISVVPPPLIDITADRDFIPATTDYNITINVTIIDPSVTDAKTQVVFGGNLNVTILNYTSGVVLANQRLNATDPVVVHEPPYVYVAIKIYGSVAFSNPSQVLNGLLKIDYKSPSGPSKSISIPIKAVDVSISVNGTSSVNVIYGNVISITVVNPAADTDRSQIDQLSVTVIGNGVTTVLTLNETAPGSGVFTSLVQVGNETGIFALPGGVITFRYVHNSSIETPIIATTWSSKTVTASAKVLATEGFIASPADGSKIGSRAVLNITIVDPDRNTNINSPDSISYSIRFWNGTIVSGYTASETGRSTGVFSATISISSLGDPRELIGNWIDIIYTDLYTPTGPVAKISRVFIISFDGVVKLDKTFYMPGDVINISVTDLDEVGRGTLKVRVNSTSDITGKEVTLIELPPGSGVFIGYILVSSDPAQFTNPNVIFAKPGDTVTVIYTDEFPADYAQTKKAKDFVASAAVGQISPTPVVLPQPEQVSIVYPNGTPATTPLPVNTLLIFLITINNTNPTPISPVVIFTVLDANGEVKVLQVQIPTIPGGGSVTVGFSYTFTQPGNYTVRIVAIKSLQDPTPLAGTKLEFTVTVAGSGSPGSSGSSTVAAYQDYRARERL